MHPNHADEDKALSRITAKYLRRKPTERMAPFTRDWLIDLHVEIFRKVNDGIAGKLRKGSARLGGSGIRVSHHSRIFTDLHNLAADLHVWQGDPIANAAELHWRAVQIHPFNDGNGRWARLLASIWIRQKTGDLLQWPVDIRSTGGSISPLRKEYLAAMDQAMGKGEPAAIEDMHRHLTRPWIPPNPK